MMNHEINDTSSVQTKWWHWIVSCEKQIIIQNIINQCLYMEDKSFRKFHIEWKVHSRKIEATTKLHLIYQNVICLYLLQVELFSNSIYPIKCFLHNCWKYNYNLLHCSLWHVIIHLCRLANDVNIIPFEPFKKLDDEIK